MKRDSSFIEFARSTPFLLLVILVLLVTLGIVLSQRRKSIVKMKEDVLYVAPLKEK
jgi:hypothetical protein